MIEVFVNLGKNELSSSLEDYIEAILDLQQTHSVARVKDIADLLDVKRSSVTIALRNLSEKGLVNYTPYSVITLTAEGYRTAQAVRDRHDLLKKIFTGVLSIEPTAAESAACKMEHGMNQTVFTKMKLLLEVLDEESELAETLKTKISDKFALFPTEASEQDLDHLINLNSSSPGDVGVIRKIVGNGVAKKRYIEMGLTMGQEIRLVKAAPLDDPIEIQVRNYRLSLRRKEAQNILIEKQ